MFTILSIVLLATNCYSQKPSFDIDFNLNEIDSEIIPSGSGKFLAVDPSIAEDARITVPQLITKYGYQAETFFVTTEDGYILQLHRISGGSKSPPRKGKEVCFLLHGSEGSASTFVLSGPHHALGFRLADEGYDVWLGNSRGSLYSANHTTYKPFGKRRDQKKYWRFSLHETGYYDLPVSIDFILNKTAQTKMQVFGHSQGASSILVLASEKTEYNAKLKMIHALGPAVFLSNMKSPFLRMAAPFSNSLHKMANLLGIHYTYPSEVQRKLCKDTAAGQILCENVLGMLMGYRSDQMNSTLLPVIFGHLPAGTGVNVLAQMGQWVNSGYFRQFDYGKIKNMMKYKRLSPPDYKLKCVTAPVALYYSQGDWMATVKDVKKLSKTLPNVVKEYLIPHKYFNHFDFILGKDAPSLLYDEIIKTMKSNME